MEKSTIEYLNNRITPYRQVTVDGMDSDLLAVPAGVNIESLERFQRAPSSIKAHIVLGSTDSFCEYVNRFGGAETTVYLNVEDGQFKAVLDHPGADQPAWCRHSAAFTPKKSLEWKAWRGLHKAPINQVRLSEFIEERINDIIEPAPGEVLGAALDFQANEKLVLGSSHSLDDGSVRFTFTKDNVSKEVVFPHRIEIAIPLHDNEVAVTLEVRIRYRIDGDGALVFVVSMVKDPDTLLHDELLQLANKIRENIDTVHVYEGKV